MNDPLGPAGSLGPHLARALQRQQTQGDRALLAATVQLLDEQRSQGHVCLVLGDWAGRSGATPSHVLPPAAAWRAALLATGLCAAPGTTPRTPLVLDADDRLYLLRDHTAEQQLLAFVRDRVDAPPVLPAAELRATLAACAPPVVAAAGDEPDWQLAAAVMAVRNRFGVLSGGPGTGKTTTVAKLLTILLQRAPELRVALAAPTGKAAARLTEALRQRAAAAPRLQAQLDQLQPTTLHRLLGYLPLQERFRHGPDAPLPFDLVVVDEASMVDPGLLAVLCQALRPDTRLLLVGDRDQLAAVGSGQVLGDLCRAAAPEFGVGPALADYARAAADLELPCRSDAPPIADAVVLLRQNHRFGTRPGIGGFASALAARDPAGALAALHHGHPDLTAAPDAHAALAAVAPALLATTNAADPAAALAALGTVRILTATRHGAMGTEAWNRRVEALLADHGVPTDQPWYRGRPVLVTENDHHHQLWNGDLGVAWHDERGPFVAFPSADGGLRRLHPSRLPAHDTAWAMTVHKAQGSEFQTVLLAMPDGDGPLWQAPLIYTGITRARERAVLLAAPERLRQALGHWPQRSSGLAQGLAAAVPPAANSQPHRPAR
ncbi:MAG: exodeoxyribonuclease V subunit alpha [Planctomycetes bacterium]|nr:exodeoxyribonuclease V subunit alpha [Planctomycetota bacterium]